MHICIIFTIYWLYHPTGNKFHKGKELDLMHYSLMSLLLMSGTKWNQKGNPVATIYGGTPELKRSSKTQTSNDNVHKLSTQQLKIFSSVLNVVMMLMDKTQTKITEAN